MSEQIVFCELAEAMKEHEILHKNEQSAKQSWENAFQKWSNYMALGEGSIDGYGCCGYGSMCDWCTDNSYGRPCVRALNAMCREKRIEIDYSDYDFKKVWRG